MILSRFYTLTTGLNLGQYYKKLNRFARNREDSIIYKCLNDEIASIQTQKTDLTKKHNSERGFCVSEEGLKPFVEGLHETLLEGTIAQRRGFIRSFIKRIEIDYPEAEIDYTLPMPQKIKARTPTEEVLATVQNGVAG